MFDFSSSPLPVRNDLPAAFSIVWGRMAAPGTWWTGAERVAIVAVAREAYRGDGTAAADGIPAAAREAAALISHRPAGVTKEMIGRWQQRDLDPMRYIELVGVVSSLTAVDTFHRALGLDLEDLPEPIDGKPTGQMPEPVATLTKAWVPMVGPPSIPVSLSAVPAEMTALEALHGPMYLRYDEMGDPTISRALSRAQMELVAGRTSAINECFY